MAIHHMIVIYHVHTIYWGTLSGYHRKSYIGIYFNLKSGFKLFPQDSGMLKH